MLYLSNHYVLRKVQMIYEEVHISFLCTKHDRYKQRYAEITPFALVLHKEYFDCFFVHRETLTHVKEGGEGSL